MAGNDTPDEVNMKTPSLKTKGCAGNVSSAVWLK